MNIRLFKTRSKAPAADTINEAGGKAYAMSDKAALAQYACTGCLNSTYYASDEQQLTRTLELCRGVDPAFVARTAVYAREQGFMKDMPAVLLAHLSAQGPAGLELVKQTFRRVINNGRMLRGFVQVIRSGAAGRKSMGTAIKRLVAEWLLSRDLDDLLNDSVGNTPSVADLIKMVHPKPIASDQRAAFAYLIGKPCETEALPALYRQFESFKAEKNREALPPDVHFNLLTAMDLSPQQWAAIARNGNWHFVRMNLNTFARHGVFEQPGMVEAIAEKLRDAEQIKRARVFPYQLLAAFINAAEEVPMPVRLALQDAMEVATANVPALGSRRVYVCPDTSGSMSSPITGRRKGATTKMRCVDIAGLVAASVLRNNPMAEVLPFDTSVHSVELNPRDTVMTNAQKLARNGGGTDCGAPLRLLNSRRVSGENAAVIFVSDNESWFRNQARWRQGTSLAQEWQTFKGRNPGSKLICIDIQPYDTVQAVDDPDVLNIGGFSDAVWPVIAAFAESGNDPQHWINIIEKIDLVAQSR